MLACHQIYSSWFYILIFCNLPEYYTLNVAELPQGEIKTSLIVCGNLIFKHIFHCWWLHQNINFMLNAMFSLKLEGRNEKKKTSKKMRWSNVNRTNVCIRKRLNKLLRDLVLHEIGVSQVYHLCRRTLSWWPTSPSIKMSQLSIPDASSMKRKKQRHEVESQNSST